MGSLDGRFARTPTRRRADRWRAPVLAVSTLCAMAVAPDVAHAQAQRDPAAAEALFKAGRAASARGDHDEACAKLRESQTLDPAPGTAFYLAECEEQRGKLATAWALYEEVAQRLAPNDKRRAAVTTRAAALEKRVPRLTIRLAPSAPSDTTIARGEVAVGAASLGVPLPVDPGKHAVVASAPGREDRTWPVELAEGETKQIVVEPGARSTADASPKPSASPQPSDTSPSTRRTVGFVVGGVGVAGLVAAGVTGGILLARDGDIDKQCPQLDCTPRGAEMVRTSETLIVVNYVAWGVGIAGLGVGALLVLTSGGAPDAPTTALSPALLPGGGGLSLRRCF